MATVTAISIQKKWGNSKSYANAIGGLIGQIVGVNCQVHGCKNSGEVDTYSSGAQGSFQIGGIVGALEGRLSSIQWSENSGKVTGHTQIGGILGRTVIADGNISIRNCINKGDIIATGSIAGGLVGTALAYTFSCNIQNNVNTASVTAPESSGSLMGYAQGNVKFDLNYMTNNGKVMMGGKVSLSGYSPSGNTNCIFFYDYRITPGTAEICGTDQYILYSGTLDVALNQGAAYYGDTTYYWTTTGGTIRFLKN